MAHLPCGKPRGAAQCFGQAFAAARLFLQQGSPSQQPFGGERAGAGCAGIHRVVHIGPAPCHQRDTTLHFNPCGYVALLWPGVRTCSPTRRYSYCAGCSTASICAATRSQPPIRVSPECGLCRARAPLFMQSNRFVKIFCRSCAPGFHKVRAASHHKLCAHRLRSQSGEPVCNLCNC